MRLPGLCCNQPAIANGLFGPVRSTGLYYFRANVFIAGHALPGDKIGGDQYLYAVANGKQPLSRLRELTGDVEKSGVIAKILGRAAA